MYFATEPLNCLEKMSQERRIFHHILESDGQEAGAGEQTLTIFDNFWIPLLLTVGYFDQQQSLAASLWRKTDHEFVVRFD